MKLFLSAGEASGDLHGSELIKEFRKLDGTIEFGFLGGGKMRAVTGEEPVIDYSEMAFMGFSEVLRNLGKIYRNLSTAKAALRDGGYDGLILIDYPDFNLKLAKEAQRLGIPVFYYIPPKIWAWKTWRAKTIRKLTRGVYCIFPFEPAFYSRYGMTAEYVGNPSVEEVDEQLRHLRPRKQFLYEEHLTSRPIIALVPGSRRGEIRNNLSVMTAAVKRFRQYQSVVAGAPGIPYDYYRQFTNLDIVENGTLELMSHAEAALVTSGTATLECALTATPQVVCYRANGSRMAYEIMKRVLKVKHVSLPNLIAGRTIVPEMLLHDCTPELVGGRLEELLEGGSKRAEQLAAYEQMRRRLGDRHAAADAASAIYLEMNGRLKS